MENRISALREGQQLERIIFFSDAVFAIAITLLALELKVPDLARQTAEQELPGAVAALAPQFVSYGLSFLVVAIFWIGHHRMFRWIDRHDVRLIWFNMLFLFGIAVLPFPTAMFGMYINTRYATVFYAASVAMIGFAKALVWHHASQGHRLIDPSTPPPFIRAQTFGGLLVPVVFLVSIPLAWVDIQLAQLSWIAMAVFAIVLPRFVPDRPPRLKEEEPQGES